MGNPLGRRVLSETIGRSIGLSADGVPIVKPAGITLDWTTVAAVTGADVTLADGIVVPIGKKYLRYGQLVTQITTGGKYGPYDPAAADGRQLRVRGQAFLLQWTILEDWEKSDHLAVALEGGLVYRARLIATAGTASLAAGPTFTELEALFPMLRYAIQ